MNLNDQLYATEGQLKEALNNLSQSDSTAEALINEASHKKNKGLRSYQVLFFREKCRTQNDKQL